MIDKIRATLQWWRVPLGVVFVVAGVYFIRRESAWLWAGMAVTLVGEVIQLWAASHLAKDKRLATSGPYSYVRNPMYVGRFFVLMGFMVMIDQSWSYVYRFPVLTVVYVILFSLYARGRVGREESRLAGIFGDEYAGYCKELSRFFPRLHRYSQARIARWQWSQIVTNHEYLNLIAILVVFAVILIRLNLYR